MNFLSALAPRSLGTLLSIICVGGAMAYSVSQQTPVGRVRGRVVLGENHKPLAHVKITLTSAEPENASLPEDERGVRRFRTVTDANGQWQLSGVAVGFYQVSAASRAHSIDKKALLVSEDETLEVPLELKPSQPDLQLTLQQNEFLPSEVATLPVHGYVDGQKPPGTDTLKLRIFRARLADILRDPKSAQGLGRVSNRYERVGAIPYDLLHPGTVPAPRLVETRTIPLKGADIEGFYHERIKLGNLGAGLYIVDVTHGQKTACAQMLVSDTALVVKKARGQLLAYAVDSQTGTPRPNAAIQVFKAGKTVASTRTDTQGLAKIDISHPTESGSGDRLLTLASYGGSEATVGQYDYQNEDDEGHGNFTVHAYTDRPIYRPGGTVSYKGILRRTVDTGLRYAVPIAQPVTVEVRDPSGERVAQANLTTNNYGSFHGRFDLSSESPSGSYSIVMTIGDEEHTSDFTVASYRKPEFSATVTPNEKHYSFGEPVEMMVNSTYYFGAPVAGAKVHYTLMRSPDWSSFLESDAEGEAGSDTDSEDEDSGQYNDSSGEIVREGDLTLDANGSAILRFTPQLHEESEDEESQSSDESLSDSLDEPQDHIYTTALEITDAADRAVEASGNVLITAGDFRLSAQTEGYFAAPRQATAVSIAARDFDNKPVPGKPVALYCQYRQWDSENNKWQDGKTQLYRGTTGADGIAKITIAPPREGVLYLSAQAQDAKNRDIIATQSLWVSGEEGGDYDAQYTSLALLTDKKRYKSGETAKVLVNTQNSGGTALLTVEGSRLFKEWLVPLKHKSTAVQVPLTDNFGPNITLAVCMVRDKTFASSQAPLRVEVPERALKVEVTSDRAKYAPGEKVTYHLKTMNSRGKPVPANVSFGVVDEAIYALQEDDASALRRAFYPTNPNSVQTNYSFEPLYLGDVNKAEPNIEARRKFVDTAFWKPEVQTDNDGNATVAFNLPDNLTTWRATAVAQTLDTAFGRRIQKVVVAKDFFVRLDTPRFFTGGDRTQITALVHNDTGEAQEATVKMEAQGLALEGDTSRTISVAAGTVGEIIWPVSTDATGLNFANTAQLKLSAWTPNDSKQWTDAIETVVPVRARGRERIDNFVGNLQKKGTVIKKLPFDTSSISSASQVSIRITPSVSDALVGGLRYLTGFPYGCTEQTMSRFMPDILVQRTLRLRGLKDPEAQKLASKLPIMVRDGLTRLKRFQHGSGGWGWWESDADDPWMTAYVLYGLAQAKAEGYEVSEDMVSQGRDAAVKMLGVRDKKLPLWQTDNWRNTQAFLLYAIAGSSPTTEELAKVKSYRATFKTTELDPQALSYLVLLDKQLGTKNSWPELESQLSLEGSQLVFWKGSGRDEWSDWNDKTATATGLRAMIATNPIDRRIPAILLWLMAHRENESWGNTRDTSWILNALCDYLSTQKKDDSNQSGVLKINLNGKTLENYDLSPATTQGEFVLRIPWKQMRTTGNTLTLERTQNGEPIFYAVQTRQTIGSDQTLPPLTSSIPIKVTREYRRLVSPAAGSNSWDIQSQPTNNQLKQGDRVRVRLTFEVPKDLSYVLIEDAFPSGCETTERGSAGESSEDWDYWWSETDIRDDRIAFFARHMSKGKHTIEYNLRAQTPGTYSALPTFLQAMYAPEVKAESAETQLKID
jgi:uncharacterized protein YfaS (alpha-2-macroglobulin family)